MKRCTKCILSENYPLIKFTKEGLCSYCTDWNSKYELEDSGKKKANLMKILEQDKNSCDVIVPFSGGKDSTYALYLLKEEYGLRPLAVNFSNGFQSNQAIENIKRTTDLLGVDLITIKPNLKLMMRLYRCFLMHTGEFCSVCNAMGYLLILSFALRFQNNSKCAPVVVAAWSEKLESQPHVYSFDINYFINVIKNDQDLCDDLISSSLIDKSVLEFMTTRSDPRIVDNKGKEAVVRFIQLPNFLDWNIEHISRTLKDNLGWVAPEDETHFDCWAHPISEYLQIKKYGFGQSTITYSNMIRDGQISREKALELVLRQTDEEPKIMKEFLQRLDLKKDEIAWNGKWHAN